MPVINHTLCFRIKSPHFCIRARPYEKTNFLRVFILFFPERHRLDVDLSANSSALAGIIGRALLMALLRLWGMKVTLPSS